ncbi:AsnC-like ligand binding domain protein [compost metagenome]
MELDTLSRQLLDRFQKGLPICAEPYRMIAEALGCEEQEVLQRLERLHECGALSRVGPVFEHRLAGASTLAALAVPPERLEAVAQRISSYPEVNHNYQREHFYNLWFVLTADNRDHIDAVLDEIAADTGLSPLDLPMLQAYHIDLAFPPFGTTDDCIRTAR